MATIIGEAAVRVTADTRGFAKDVDRGVGGAFRKVAGLAAGIFAGIQVGRLFTGAIEEAQEAQKVLAQTGAVLKSTGGVANVTAGDIEELSTNLSNLVGVDDELVAQAANVFLTFTKVRNEAGKGNDVFTQATSAALDLSAALGQDLQGSVIQIGKALNDPIRGITALRRVGVAFTKDQEAQIKALAKSGDLLGAQKLILAELKTEFGGTAAAIATPLDKLKVAFDNIKESLGTALAPALGNLATIFSEKVLPAITPVITVLGTVLGDVLVGLAPLVQVLGEAFATLLPVLGPLIAALAGALLPVFQALIPALAPVIAALAEGLTEALITLTPSLVIIAENFANLLIAMTPLLPVLFDLINIVLKLVTVALNPLLQILGFLTSTIMGVVITALTTVIGVFTNLGGTVNWLGGVFGTVFGFVSRLVSTLAGLVSGALNSAFNFLAAVARSVGDAFQWVADKVSAVIGWFRDLLGAVNSVLGPLRKAIDLAGDVAGGIGGFIGGLWPFAEGGIVMGPTRALIGEAGPEVVIPLTDRSRAMDLLQASGLAGLMRGGTAQPVASHTFNIYEVGDAQATAERIVNRLAVG